MRLAVARHKVRLSAEFTKARLKRGFSSTEALRTHFDSGLASEHNVGPTANKTISEHQKWRHPRWVRINTVKTTLEEQLNTTFADYTAVNSIEELLGASSKCKPLYIDRNIPDLVAVSPHSDLTSTAAYRSGHVILQDKASCFPAYMLGTSHTDRDYLDACAAPGNKTTHLAAILRKESLNSHSKTRVFACERDKARATTLQKMVNLAGVNGLVSVQPGQDFLKLDPDQPPWNKVGSILLDPSCSGSGIVGRDEVLNIALPTRKHAQDSSKRSRKRKRQTENLDNTTAEITEEMDNPSVEPEDLDDRLRALSAFQLKIILHAFRFPKASRVVYSTCSVHAQENEHVVMKALLSSEALKRDWRIMEVHEQPTGLQSWRIRGNHEACLEVQCESTGVQDYALAEQVASACIRCEKGTKEGTQGFFVAGFVRSGKDDTSSNHSGLWGMGSRDSAALELFHSESEWEGFDDSDGG